MPKQGWGSQGDERVPCHHAFTPFLNSALLGSPAEQNPPKTLHPSEQFHPPRRKRRGLSTGEGKLEMLRLLCLGFFLRGDTFKACCRRSGCRAQVWLTARVYYAPFQCHNKTPQVSETGAITWGSRGFQDEEQQQSVCLISSKFFFLGQLADDIICPLRSLTHHLAVSKETR